MNDLSEKSAFRWEICLLLCLLALITYANIFKNDFVGYDDENLIVNNTTIRSLSPDAVAEMFAPRQRGNYQPLRNLSYAIDYSIWGLRPFGFHLTNITLHIFTILLVWLFVGTLAPKPIPLLSAIIFAVHPIHVESVTWMSSRKDVLSLTFFILAILLYERSETNRKPLSYAFSIFFTAMALLSKLTAVTLPACMLLVEFCRDGLPTWRTLGKKLVRLSPHILLVLVVIGLNFLRSGAAPMHGDSLKTLSGAGGSVTHDIWLSMPLVVCRYIGMLFLPVDLCTHYDVARISNISDPRVIIPSIVILAVIAGGILCFLRGHRLMAFCIGWFFITFLPTSNIIPAASMMTDRYMHVPSIGFAVLLGLFLANPIKRMNLKNSPIRRLLVISPVVLLVLLLSILTIRRNADWRDTSTLFNRTLKVNPESVDAHLALGALHSDDGDYNSAIKMYQDALRLSPGHYRVLYNLGITYLKMGWTRQALRSFEESRNAHPNFHATLFNLALLYHKEKRYDEAIATHQEALRINPSFAASHGDLGRIYKELNDIDKALEHLALALEIRPDLIPAFADQTELFILQGNDDEAKRNMRRLESLGFDISELKAKLESS